MIKMKGRTAVFTGKDLKNLLKLSKTLGLTPRDCMIGLLWELVMREARKGLFLKGKNDSKVE